MRYAIFPGLASAACCTQRCAANYHRCRVCLPLAAHPPATPRPPAPARSPDRPRTAGCGEVGKPGGEGRARCFAGGEIGRRRFGEAKRRLGRDRVQRLPADRPNQVLGDQAAGVDQAAEVVAGDGAVHGIGVGVEPLVGHGMSSSRRPAPVLPADSSLARRSRTGGGLRAVSDSKGRFPFAIHHDEGFVPSGERVAEAEIAGVSGQRCAFHRRLCLRRLVIVAVLIAVFGIQNQ